jgi:putative hemolysin
MISGILDIAARPVKEIMIPRPQVKALEIGSSFKEILDIVLSAGFSRFPVFRGRLDNVEGSIHTKDIIPYLIDNKEFKINDLLRKPFFVPESAPLEKVLVQMQEEAIHLAFVVDEFGSMEGIVTLEDIIEEIVGDIQDEYDAKGEEWFSKTEENAYIIKGTASIKEINQRLPLKLPEKGEYTTLAGFFLFEYGKIPHEKDILDYKGYQFVVEKMNKRHISLIRVNVKQKEDYSRDENNRRK